MINVVRLDILNRTSWADMEGSMASLGCQLGTSIHRVNQDRVLALSLIHI